MAEIKLGDMARDTVTGFTGKVIGITKWLNGCTVITLKPTSLDKDGKPFESVAVDEPQVELVEAAKIPVKEKGRGGPPKSDPTRSSH